ncbi:histidine kinase, partial [Bacillus cereus group sp. N11]|nr:histidine kinase [Bacillus cereus group sp. N11]
APAAPRGAVAAVDGLRPVVRGGGVGHVAKLAPVLPRGPVGPVAPVAPV